MAATSGFLSRRDIREELKVGIRGKCEIRSVDVGGEIERANEGG